MKADFLRENVRICLLYVLSIAPTSIQSQLQAYSRIAYCVGSRSTIGLTSVSVKGIKLSGWQSQDESHENLKILPSVNLARFLRAFWQGIEIWTFSTGVCI